MVPPQITQWLDQAYPKPKIDPEWLDACYAWITNEMNLDPASQMNEIITNVEVQLLESDLRDSMIRSTGLPANISTLDNIKLQGPPVLVEIVAMTEIGHSAFNLQTVRQTRVDRADLAGLGGDDAGEDDEGPVPKYPRTMLRFELSDGTVILPAIEYRPLPEFDLGETPLGYKMLVKNVLIRRGIAFLEPQCVVVKGHKTEERAAMQDADFVRGLRRRLGRPDPVPEEANPAPGAPLPGPPPGGQPPQTINTSVRSPLRELSEPPEPLTHPLRGGIHYDDDDDLPRKRRVPNPTPGPAASASSSASTLIASQYFSGPASSVNSTAPTCVDPSEYLSRMLSPARGEPIVIEDSSMEEDREPQSQAGATILTSNIKGKSRVQSVAEASSDFDYGDDGDVDDAFWEEVAEVEKAAMEMSASQVPQSNRKSQPDILSPPSLAPIAVGVITIDDDEDEEDKENVPVATRRVRRRVTSGIIDISD